MKKYKNLFLIFVLTLASISYSQRITAQKVALIDMEYILSKVPAYEMANSQLDKVSKKWQKEVEDLNNEAKGLYTRYKSEKVYLSDEMKKKKEEEILAKEKEASTLKMKYFGRDGDLFKKRESLIKPIQDEIYNAVKQISEEDNYMLILDRASDAGIIFASPKMDISDLVLNKLGL